MHRYYRPAHARSRTCLDFVLKQKHYKQDEGQTLDRTRVQPKGAETFNTIRHKTAQIAGQSTYFECWPTDQQDDPQAAEAARRVLESIVQDPLKRYRPCKRRMVLGALVASTWYCKVEWDSSIGPYGDLRFSSLAPFYLLPAPGWQDIHDPKCPYVIEWADLPIDFVRSKAGKGENAWKDLEDLWPDNQGQYKSQDEYTRSLSDSSPDEGYGPDTVRVVMMWERSDPALEKKEGSDYNVLPEAQRYMACPDCGYKTMEHPTGEQGPLPLEGGLCPVCYDSVPQGFSSLLRIDAHRQDERYLRYPKGRLRICLPIQRRMAYDGGWPCKMRSFPFFQFRAYENPEEYHGLSDTMLHGNNQVILNSLRRMGYEQMRTSRSVIIVAGGPDNKGLLDSRGREFRFSDENGCVAYTQGQTVQNMVQHVQGQGLPAQWATYHQTILNSFEATQGTSDLGLTPASSKDIAASTVKQLTEMGEIPVADHRDVLNEEESIFLGVALDIWIANTTAARAVRYLGPDGNMVVDKLRGADVATVDVIVTASPQIRQAHMDQFQSFSQWAAMPPPLRRLAAEMLNIPLSKVGQLEAEEAKAAQTQGPPVPGATPPAPNGTPPPASMVAGMGAPPAPGM